eukprot:3259462-Amphidinium_carterae.1
MLRHRKNIVIKHMNTILRGVIVTTIGRILPNPSTDAGGCRRDAQVVSIQSRECCIPLPFKSFRTNKRKEPL